ncbi:protein lethal(2)essential for life-like [Vespa mandarinia]|uniref:protein lethal(2)essential for life-like n=1 Tax=Vespa mandarinia TaxID=7446 RepID=UPI00160BD2AC|nr:protein lethal(2)essential for life-like [Vespa mandarinia]
MSLLPILFSNWWENLDRPHRIFHQHFGLSLNPEDLPSSWIPYDTNTNLLIYRPRRHLQHRHHLYERGVTRKTSGTSTVEADKNRFQVTLDVQQFAPDEVTVKVIGKNVMVEGKHEEKQDEHGLISRQFLRKYMIPEQCDIDQLYSTLSSDGILTIIVPKKILALEEKERIIKIQNTGQPALKDNVTKYDETEKEKDLQNQKSPVQQREQDKTVKAA